MAIIGPIVLSFWIGHFISLSMNITIPKFRPILKPTVLKSIDLFELKMFINGVKTCYVDGLPFVLKIQH